MRAIAFRPLDFQPESQFEYSNTNYVLLGMIVERVAGTSFGSYLQNAVLDPVQLRATRYGDAPEETAGYVWNGGFAAAPPVSTQYAYAAAALSSNVPDLLRWLRRDDAGYGFFSADMYGYQVRYATGNVDGYSAFEMTVPTAGDALVLLTNADGLDLRPLAKSVFALLEPPAPGTYARGFAPAQDGDPRTTAQIKGLLSELAAAAIDRGALSARYRAALAQAEIDGFAKLLAPPDGVTLLEFIGRETAAAGTSVRYRVRLFAGRRIGIAVLYDRDGAIDGISISDR